MVNQTETSPDLEALRPSLGRRAGIILIAVTSALLLPSFVKSFFYYSIRWIGMQTSPYNLVNRFRLTKAWPLRETDSLHFTVKTRLIASEFSVFTFKSMSPISDGQPVSCVLQSETISHSMISMNQTDVCFSHIVCVPFSLRAISSTVFASFYISHEVAI